MDIELGTTNFKTAVTSPLFHSNDNNGSTVASAEVVGRDVIDELVKLVKNNSDYFALDKLAELARGSLSTRRSLTIFDIAPSLKELSSNVKLRGGSLADTDRECANKFCMDLCRNYEQLDRLEFPNKAITKTPGMMDRLLLFDSDDIEIRAHLFFTGVQETYIHHHGQAFITTCISGSYLHRIWSVCDNDKKKFYVHRRCPGVVYPSEVPTKRDGELENILAQPFEVGQSLFISAMAQHTVQSLTGPLITIVIREKKKRFECIEILTPNQTIEQPTEQVIVVKDQYEREDVIQRFQKSLKALLSKRLIDEPSKWMYETVQNVKSSLNTIHELVSDIHSVSVVAANKDILFASVKLALIIWCWRSSESNWNCFTNSLWRHFVWSHHGNEIKRLCITLGCSYEKRENEKAISANNLIENVAESVKLSNKYCLHFVFWYFAFTEVFQKPTHCDEVDVAAKLEEYFGIPNLLIENNKLSRQVKLAGWLHKESDHIFNDCLVKPTYCYAINYAMWYICLLLILTIFVLIVFINS